MEVWYGFRRQETSQLVPMVWEEPGSDSEVQVGWIGRAVGGWTNLKAREKGIERMLHGWWDTDAHMVLEHRVMA